MHGNSAIKFIVAKQTKEIYKYKTTKRKDYRTNAAIWFNKTCRQTPVAAVTVYRAPDDGRKGRPKHVAQSCILLVYYIL